MRPFRFFTRAALAALVLGPAWLLASPRSEAATTFLPAGAGAAVYLEASAPELWSSALPDSGRAALPRSTRNDPGQRCSVEIANPPPQPCSSSAGGISGACSAIADQGHACSVFGVAGAPAGSAGSCSTMAANNAVCSVGRPRAGSPNPSDCSTYAGPAGTTARCSTVVRDTRNQFCSADNQGRNGNRCSAVASMGGAGQCSVTERSATNRCSVNGNNPAGSDRCSTLVGNGAFCSILASGTGATCTAFGGAAAQQCSAFVGNSHCSVLGGPGPQNGVCR